MPGVGGTPGHDRRGDPRHPGRGGGPAWGARRGRTAGEIRVIRAEVAARRGGPPHRVRSDNGPEFAAEAVRGWLEGTGSGALYVAPASPWQDGYAESFHSKLRDEFLDREEFESEPQARALGTLWKEEYNTERPHSSL